MNWQVEWLDEAKKDMRKLGKAEQIQVLKGIEKVRTNPLPTSQGGYGKPLRNAERTKLSRLCKIKGSARKVAHFGSWPSMAR